MKLLRPNSVSVKRRNQGAKDKAGEPVVSIATIYAALPALIDAIPAQARLSVASVTGGPSIEQTHTLYLDGIKVSGYSPGDIVVARGLSLKVSGNGRGAFPDLKVDDRVDGEDGRSFLVVALAYYYDVYPSLQVGMAEGKAW